MKNPESTCGTIGWGLLTAGIIAWDLIAPETLSSAYDRYLERPVSRALAIGAVAITGAHLLNQIPQQIDPIHQSFNLGNKAIQRIIR